MAIVIGTAGHIDHGKTALVHALSGQDTDRLAAEKSRGISIDLGFAHFTLPGGDEVSLIDVPGHERFIRNMVAGAHALDLVLFVIAADDGVMPQSEEHFDILSALKVKQAIFVVTKIDMVEPDRLIEVAEEIAMMAEGSRFETAEILPVSSLTGAGLDALLQRIETASQTLSSNDANGAFRMPIDRVFSVHGRGVVLTGTVLSGTLTPGEDVFIQPGGVKHRVRGLQTHGVDVAQGRAGNRLAINLTGAEKTAIHRGDVACAARISRASGQSDVRLSLAAHARQPLKNGQRLRLHLGTAERLGRVLLLGERVELQPGETGFARIIPDQPVHILAGDLFVIRDEPGEHTLGGGQVLDPIASNLPRHDAGRLAVLTALAQDDALQSVLAMLAPTDISALEVDDTGFRLNLSPDQLIATIRTCASVLCLPLETPAWITDKPSLSVFNQKLHAELTGFHQKNPTLTGLGAEALKDRIAPDTNPDLFRHLLAHLIETGEAVRDGALLGLPGHHTGLSDHQKKRATAFLSTLNKTPFSPPAPNDKDPDEKTIVAYLEKQGDIVRVAQGLVFDAKAYQLAGQKLSDHFSCHDQVTAAEFRDLLGTSRKYALALLEHFDRVGRTVRIGDSRKSGKP